MCGWVDAWMPGWLDGWVGGWFADGRGPGTLPRDFPPAPVNVPDPAVPIAMQEDMLPASDADMFRTATFAPGLPFCRPVPRFAGAPRTRKDADGTSCVR